jgi:hypothetical protein
VGQRLIDVTGDDWGELIADAPQCADRVPVAGELKGGGDGDRLVDQLDAAAGSLAGRERNRDRRQVTPVTLDIAGRRCYLSSSDYPF